MGFGAESSRPWSGASQTFLANLGEKSRVRALTTSAKSCIDGSACKVAPVHGICNRLPLKVGTLEFTSGTGLCWWELQPVTGDHG